MKTFRLDDMVRGWFVGDFSPSVVQTEAVEVGVRKYVAGDHEQWHLHKVTTELTAIVAGEVTMNGQRYSTGNIVLIEPGEGTDFHCLTDVTTVVVKLPSVKNDKYFNADLKC